MDAKSLSSSVSDQDFFESFLYLKHVYGVYAYRLHQTPPPKKTYSHSIKPPPQHPHTPKNPPSKEIKILSPPQVLSALSLLIHMNNSVYMKTKNFIPKLFLPPLNTTIANICDEEKQNILQQ